MAGAVVDSDEEIFEILKDSHTIAVLGMKGDDRKDQPAYSVPEYLQSHGYTIHPVPVLKMAAQEILGEKVYRKVADIPGTVDVVEVFRKSEDIPAHIPDIIAAEPRVVWFQKGIRNDEAARKLVEAGILVVQDRCMRVEHQRMEEG